MTTLPDQIEALVKEIEADFGRKLRMGLLTGQWGVLLAEVWIAQGRLRREPEIQLRSRHPTDRLRQRGR